MAAGIDPAAELPVEAIVVLRSRYLPGCKDFAALVRALALALASVASLEAVDTSCRGRKCFPEDNHKLVEVVADMLRLRYLHMPSVQ